MIQPLRVTVFDEIQSPLCRGWSCNPSGCSLTLHDPAQVAAALFSVRPQDPLFMFPLNQARHTAACCMQCGMTRCSVELWSVTQHYHRLFLPDMKT